MKRKSIIFISLITLFSLLFLAIIISYALGICYKNKLNSSVKTYSEILIFDSHSFDDFNKASNVIDVIERIIMNCEIKAEYIRTPEFLLNEGTKKKSKEALDTWHKTKKKLQYLFSLYREEIDGDPNIYIGKDIYRFGSSGTVPN